MSYDLCAKFVSERMSGYRGKSASILDVGSLRVGGGPIVRPLFDDELWKYSGLDVCPGNNVDIVSPEPYSFPFEDSSWDVVISTNTLEHVENIHALCRELTRVTRDLVYVDAPNRWKIHRYPIDCWRILPDGMRFLLEDIAGLKILEIGTNGSNTYGIASKK